MAKMYTLDSKLLTGTPEIRIGDSVYPVDDREKTVKKIMKLFDEEDVKNSVDNIDKVFALVFSPKDYKKIDSMNMRFEAYQRLLEIVMAAITGEDYDPERKEDDTFREQ
ncbi:MAG: hypothetical protein IJM75_06320 [Ruminococcus sp.]|nr:hypothetical protein [Ruminococcus sp.]